MIMARYRVHVLLEPPGPFGLPDGEKVVIPTGPTDPRTYISPTLDTRTGQIADYGTLSEYRRPESAFTFAGETGAARIEVRDNFLSCEVDATTPREAYDIAEREIDRICRGLTVTYGARFSAAFRFIETLEGEPLRHPRPRMGMRFGATFYNFAQLRSHFAAATTWSYVTDPRLAKALLYAEHAHILHEVAGDADPGAEHSAFTYALAFLQLFKAVTAILGEPGTDRDYQRRFREIGLPDSFWDERVKPLLLVRNDEDVAHYSLEQPAVGELMRKFSEAAKVLRECIAVFATTHSGTWATLGWRTPSCG
jgi:hypothetical protein